MTVEIRPMVIVGATRPEGCPSSEGIWNHWRLGFCGLVPVVGLEESLMSAQLHGLVGVREEVGEAGCEVAHKVIRDGAQRLLNLHRELPVVVFLISHGSEEISDRATFVSSEFAQICL